MRRKLLIFILCMLIIPPYAFSKEVREWEWIKPGRLYGLMKEGSGVWLIDVRNSRLYSDRHIEGAVNIPLVSLKNRNLSRSKLYVLVDGSPGHKFAREAAEVLLEKRFRNIYVLEGGVAGWELEGYPMVWSEHYSVPSVTADELRWALDNSVPMKIFDLRTEAERKKGSIPSSKTVPGNTYEEKMENLRNILSQGSGLSDSLTGPETVMLVFSAFENARQVTEKFSFGMKKDIRYLFGGYEAYEALAKGRSGEKRTTGECPVCPGTN